MNVVYEFFDGTRAFHDIERLLLFYGSWNTISTQVNIHFIVCSWNKLFRLPQEMSVLNAIASVIVCPEYVFTFIYLYVHISTIAFNSLPVRADPERIETIFILENVQRFIHLTEWHKHILNHMCFFINFLDLLSLGQLQEGHFRWHRPPKQPSKDGVVACI